ncbi:MAG: penicillin acylase family protein [Acidobacteria bacterium]|nr:penicillin acylase family protein [Acidobacteriota bacterium]
MAVSRIALALASLAGFAEEVRVTGLKQPVEIIRDRWGMPHIYAQNQDDLFFAQGYIAARDRLWQIDIWRRQANGTLSEVLGPEYVEKDRISRLLRFRGDWQKEWPSYAPDTWHIVNAWVRGVNAYIQNPARKKTAEFQKLRYDAGLWTPNDVVARVGVFSMLSNIVREIARARELDAYGAATLEKWNPPDPFVKLETPRGINLKDVRRELFAPFGDGVEGVAESVQGSNNWVISSKLSATGKPLLANDPHRTLQIPSLRKTFHLVAPGWNAIGAGEPAQPGIALGHNESIGFGFTITGTDQQDLYVEQLHTKDSTQYLYKGEWKKLETERQQIFVKGEKPRIVETQYTIHGPVIAVDLPNKRAFVMKWIGGEPGTAGYLASLSIARAKNWQEFLGGVARFKAPAENIVYADTAGNIGMAVAGLAPKRGNWTGIVPVSGHTGEYEWQGYLDPGELPRQFNPVKGLIATANNNILPPGYKNALQYEWAPPYRAQRIEQQLLSRRGWTVEAFESLQQDVVSPPAVRLLKLVRSWYPSAGSKAASVLPMLKAWDGRMSLDSSAAAVWAMWMSRIQAGIGSPGVYASIEAVFKELEARPNFPLLEKTLNETVAEFEKGLGADRNRWRYGNLHFLYLRHFAQEKSFDRGPIPLPGDAYSINVYQGAGFRASFGASLRIILDFADWDRSRMTNAPGESGDPASPHYDDLLDDWVKGKYHPMPFTRKAVEAAAKERIQLLPAR